MDLRAKEIEVRIRCCESLGLQTLNLSNSYDNIEPINEQEEEEEDDQDNIQRHNSKLPVHKSISA